ncbi:acyl-CoA dehydrogenase family protein [Halioxenophilus sp. WMMB6]|uniref:acyl-CoA dehydrogenase family protein n=1 Tax=Halioxenophilus sp. WMMB6 TaxID=3073815 RepID=UPI00295EA888|nr:acyl-CoA dehydrogenase family protein [Halioxenophilus sp. WMMB6]
MSLQLTEDQLAFQEAARSFARGEMAPQAARWDEEKIFPREVIAAAGELGFCGMYSPEAYGGLGLSRLDTTIILEELAGGCTSTAAFISIHNMATWMLCTWGSEAIKSEWAEKLTSGQCLASYCLTEPNAGSDAGSLRSSARLDGDDYIINGSKMFISGAGATEVLVAMIRTGAPDSGAKGISAFAIPANLPGIEYGKNEVKLGWNSQPTRAISFDNVRVPKECLLGEEGEGFKIAMKGIDGGRINIAACSVGAAQACIDITQEYIRTRQQFGKPIAENQALQFRLADMVTELVAARQMVHMAAQALDMNHPEKTVYCAMAKRFATDVGFEVCNQCLQMHGGYGYLREYPIERYLRDVRVHQILEGSNEIMRVITGRRLLQDNATQEVR